jgi:hypothetical protein
MNPRQKRTLGIGAALAALMLAYPPWSESPDLQFVADVPVARYGRGEVGYAPLYRPDPASELRGKVGAGFAPLWDPPGPRFERSRVQLDLDRLLVQWLLLAGAVGFVFWVQGQEPARQGLARPGPPR